MTTTSAAGGEPIIVITHEFFPRRGGIATFSEEMARAAAELGCDIEVWAQAARGPEKRDWPFRVRRLPLAGTQDPACQVRLAREWVRERRRLSGATVYLPEPGPMLTLMALQFVRSLQPRRLLLTFHGSEILRFSRNPVRRWLARRLIGSAARVSTLSIYTRNLLLRHFPIAAGRVVHTPGALRSDVVVAASASARAGAVPGMEIGGSLAPEKGKLVVLTVGRLHPRKGQLVTLRALQSLPPELRERIEYWIVGTAGRGGYAAELHAAAAASMHPVVRFLGEVADAELARVYGRADIFAMTSLDLPASVEGFGLAYLEASAHGLPIVAHDVGGVSEAVLEGTTGLLVRPGMAGELAAALEKLVGDAALRQRLGSAGREWAMRCRWTDAARTLFTFEPRP
jgi:phosphatidyl-myo-inositol dimannoside synthase